MNPVRDRSGGTKEESTEKLGDAVEPQPIIRIIYSEKIGGADGLRS